MVDTGSDIRSHDEISSGSLSRVELYHKLMHDNKQLIYEMKIGIISVIGSIIIIVCLIYIAIQCRRSSNYVYNNYIRNRRTDKDSRKKLLHRQDSTESLLQTKAFISINGGKCDKEFYV